jgi:hypothetical protein
MRRLFRLPTLALAVWAAWLGLVAAMALMLAMQAWAPHFLPITILLLWLVVSGVALIVGGLWRLAVGPWRRRALTCLLLGVPPLLFFASHFLYGLKAGYGRQVELNYPLKMLIPFGESCFDLMSRFVYPVRTEGETVVMISQPVANASAQVAVMDRHIQSLWKRLGDVSTTRRVHWVRGPLMSITAHAFYGMCLGSVPGKLAVDADGLTWLDRHEVAHCVLSSFMPTDIEPPSVLSEGWAQANQGDDEKTVALRAWEGREQGELIPLRELTGPVWYNRRHWPAYNQGAALVNHVLRKHGPTKFMEMYAQCRPGTFDATCQRVLGVSLDDLDTAYRAEIDKFVRARKPPRTRLETLEVRPPVDPAAWNAFATEYLAASKTLAALYDHVDMTVEQSDHVADGHGKSFAETTRLEYRRSGDLMSLHATSPGREAVLLATPVHSVEARRRKDRPRWEISDPLRDDPALAYRRISKWIMEGDPVYEAAFLLRDTAEKTKVLVDATYAVTALERFSESGRPLMRVRLEDTSPRAAFWRSVTFFIAADDHLAVRSAEVIFADGSRRQTGFTYDHEAGLPVLGSSRRDEAFTGGRTQGEVTRIVARRFGPVPASEFTEERLLDGPVVHKPAPSDEEQYKDPVTFADWYRAVFVAGLVSLALGLLAGALGGFRRPAAA